MSMPNAERKHWPTSMRLACSQMSMCVMSSPQVAQSSCFPAFLNSPPFSEQQQAGWPRQRTLRRRSPQRRLRYVALLGK